MIALRVKYCECVCSWARGPRHLQIVNADLHLAFSEVIPLAGCCRSASTAYDVERSDMISFFTTGPSSRSLESHSMEVYDECRDLCRGFKR